MLRVVLMIYLGMQIGVPVWYYIICGLILFIEAIKIGVQIQKNRE